MLPTSSGQGSLFDDAGAVVLPEHLERAIRARFRKRMVVCSAVSAVAAFIVWVLVGATFGRGVGAVASGLLFTYLLTGFRRWAEAHRVSEIMPYVEQVATDDDEQG